MHAHVAAMTYVRCRLWHELGVDRGTARYGADPFVGTDLQGIRLDIEGMFLPMRWYGDFIVR